jgi:hypothetical protein
MIKNSQVLRAMDTSSEVTQAAQLPVEDRSESCQTSEVTQDAPPVVEDRSESCQPSEVTQDAPPVVEDRSESCQPSEVTQDAPQPVVEDLSDAILGITVITGLMCTVTLVGLMRVAILSNGLVYTLIVTLQP